ncbi:sulfite exporter TauE/SafE family protein [Natronomonas sp. LN261]|uniref:TSUP family transporter n=1 Tax=Natronomonas sp. LN261 TaxID=2750669 RepID=UPI0015EF98C9
MSVSLTPEVAVLIVAVVTVSGAVNGVAGFGFAVVGTMALASVFDPAVAVVFMIVPILAVNVSLLSELSAADLRDCGRRFTPLVLAAIVGTIVGMAALDRLPEAPLRIGLGIVSLSFVVSAQRLVALPGIERAKEGCFVETPAAMAAVGAASGLLFGATNVGVQLVAYVRSCDLRHGLFVGVIALVFVGINGLRVGAAAALGLYPDVPVAVGSVLAALPALVGVGVGKRLRGRIGEHARRAIVLGLLSVIGIRLLAGGFGVF